MRRRLIGVEYLMVDTIGAGDEQGGKNVTVNIECGANGTGGILETAEDTDGCHREVKGGNKHGHGEQGCAG